MLFIRFCYANIPGYPLCTAKSVQQMLEGNETKYKYDIKGRRTTYDYDLNVNLVKITYCDNTTEIFEYDAENMILADSISLPANSVCFTNEKCQSCTLLWRFYFERYNS